MSSADVCVRSRRNYMRNYQIVTSEGSDSQQVVTKQAQVSTQAIGGGNLFVFGGSCGLNPVGPISPKGFLFGLSFLGLSLVLWRRRAGA